jgi:hypothetical protein
VSSDSGIHGLPSGQSVAATDVFPADQLVGTTFQTKGVTAAQIKTFIGLGNVTFGSGAPNNANGSNGDFYFRSDGTVSGNTVVYHKESGSWVALVTAA